MTIEPANLLQAHSEGSEPAPGPPFVGITTWIRDSWAPIGSPGRLVPSEAYTEIVLRSIGHCLIYLINEKRIEGQLLGSSPEERYRNFDTINPGFVVTELKQRFPILWDRLNYTLTSLNSLCHRIVQDLSLDRTKLSEAGLLPADGGPVVMITPKGDLHSGEAVCFVQTEHSSLYYKPRGVANEVVLQECISAISELAGQDDLYGSHNHSSLHIGPHGWCTSVDGTPLQNRNDADLYYEKMGRLLFVAYLLNTTDLHFENIVASAEGPRIVDAETIFSTPLRTAIFPDEATQQANDAIFRSVAATGLLPMGTGFSVYGGDISGIAGGEFRSERRVLTNPLRDDLRYVKATIYTVEDQHLPFVLEDGERITIPPHSFVEKITKGFTASYLVACDNIPELGAFIAQKSPEVRSRLLARKTNDYGTLLSAINAISNLDRRTDLLSRLRTFSAGIPDSLVESEIRQVDDGDIPLFSCEAHKVIVEDPDGQHVATLPASPLEEVTKTLAKLSEADLDLQQRIIRFALRGQELLRANSDTRLVYKRTSEESEIPVLEAAMRKIYEEIEKDQYVSRKDSSVNWLSLGVDGSDQLQLNPMDEYLYTGIPGVGMALISYIEATNSDRPRELLATIEQTVLRSYERSRAESQGALSYYNGGLGQLAFLTRLASSGLAKFPVDLQMEIDIFARRATDLASSDTSFDVVDGAAGSILALWRTAPSQERTAAIQALAQHLISNAKKDTDGIYWDIDGRGGEQNASFGHGNSGIATALLVAATEFPDGPYREAWKRSWKFDEKHKIAQGWRDTRRPDGGMSANWCHGTTGILISRMLWQELDNVHGILTSHERDEVSQELETAMNATLRIGLDINNFCLCHGVTGNLLALDAISNHPLSAQVRNEYLSVARFGIDHAWLCGLGSQFNSYGLMTGMSGILHALATHKSGLKNVDLLVPRLWGK